jgi:NADH pyrophosphatase NudC (nudix superfamily)
MKCHYSVTASKVMAAQRATLFGTANVGFCTRCGKRDNNTDADETAKRCTKCHERTVVAACELMICDDGSVLA